MPDDTLCVVSRAWVGPTACVLGLLLSSTFSCVGGEGRPDRGSGGHLSGTGGSAAQAGSAGSGAEAGNGTGADAGSGGNSGSGGSGTSGSGGWSGSGGSGTSGSGGSTGCPPYSTTSHFNNNQGTNCTSCHRSGTCTCEDMSGC